MEIPEILAAAFLCGCRNKLIKDRAGTDNEQNFCYNIKTACEYWDLENEIWIYIQFFW